MTQKQHFYAFTSIFFIFGVLFFIFSTPVQAECVPIIACPSGNVVAGPCATGLVNCESPTPPASPSTSVSLPNPLGTDDIRIVIGRIIQILMSAIGSIALMILIYGGFQWLTAMGNPEKIKKGKDIMLWTLLGVIIMFSSYFIVRYIINMLVLGTEGVPPTTGTGAPF